MPRPLALITDFDGTITADDFFTLAAERYFDDSMLAPWRAYQSGKKKHFEALAEMFRRLRGLPDLPDFVKSIPVDSFFSETVKLCHAKEIPVYICSAGCDWYINLLIGEVIREYQICLITNHCEYSIEKGLVMDRLPPDHSCYDDNTGVSKTAVVKELKEQGYKTVFAGDGLPDIFPAREADVVFARKNLLRLCREQGIKTLPFDNFSDIFRYIKEN